MRIINHEVYERLCGQINGRIYCTVSDEVRYQMYNIVWGQIDNQLREQVTKQLKQNI
jgi:hypothetical protein